MLLRREPSGDLTAGQWVYAGQSMLPTLRSGEIVAVEPCGISGLRPGDVACFRSPEGQVLTMHRILRRVRGGLRTCGDGNSRSDPWVVAAEDVVGRVRSSHRGAHTRTIHGGLPGLVWSVLVRALRPAWRATAALLRPLGYCAVRVLTSGRGLRLRVVAAGGQDGEGQAWLTWRGRVVGRRDPRTDRWVVDTPLNLLVDPSVLPDLSCSDSPSP